MDGNQIKEARERAGMTQADLGKAVGVSMRTIGNWERGESVPRNRSAKIEEVLRPHLPHVPDGSLMRASDLELINELSRRLATARRLVSGGNFTAVDDIADALFTDLRRGPDQQKEVVGNAEHPAPMSDAGELPAQDDYGLAYNRGTPEHQPDTTKGEENQDPGGFEGA